MSQLIEELRNDHVEISDIFRQVAESGIAPEQGQNKLAEIKTLLLTHLKKEDEELYPILLKAAKNNQDLKLKLESFARDMDVITKTIFAFFEKYSGQDFGKEFENEFVNIYLALTERITNEENVLFPEYVNLKTIFDI